jgi:hypothetical protein
VQQIPELSGRFQAMQGRACNETAEERNERYRILISVMLLLGRHPILRKSGIWG